MPFLQAVTEFTRHEQNRELGVFVTVWRVIHRSKPAIFGRFEVNISRSRSKWERSTISRSISAHIV